MPATPSSAERPPTGANRLSVSGGAAPSRVGTARRSTSKTASAASPMEALTQTLVRKMREKFGDLAVDLNAQEVIAAEVRNFMVLAGSVKEEDISQLEDRIRNRLSGETPMRNNLVLQKKAVVNADEWARIYSFQCQMGQIEEKDKAARAAAVRAELRATLERQKQETQEKAKQEAEQEAMYFREQQAQLAQWESEAECKRRLQQEIIDKLKRDREEQLADRQMRRRMAVEKKEHDEAELAARIAYETKSELEKELQQRSSAKVALKELLLGNEEHKRHKEEQKLAQWETDKRYMEEYAEILQRQEKKRVEQLEKLRAVQARQAADASSRPEAKRWMDPAIVEKHFKAREEAVAREEERRLAHIRAMPGQLRASLEVQVAERQTLAVQRKELDKGYAEQVFSRVRELDAKERASKQAAEQKKERFREELLTQMKDNAMRRQVKPMSDTEKLINSQLLNKIETLRLTGVIH